MVTISNFTLLLTLFKRVNEISYAMVIDSWKSGILCYNCFANANNLYDDNYTRFISQDRIQSIVLVMQKSVFAKHMPYAPGKEIQWSGGTYLVSGEIKRLLVESPGMLVELHHKYDDFDLFNIYCCHLELQWFLDPAPETIHIWYTIQERRQDGLHISVSTISFWWFDRTLRILLASLLCFFEFL